MSHNFDSAISLLPDPEVTALIFDCDGTLVHSAPFHYEAINHAVRAMGIKMGREWYQKRFGLSLQGLINALQDDFGVAIDKAAFNANHTRFYLEHLQAGEKLHEIASVTAIVRQYAGKLPMAVASNSNRQIVDASLEAIGIESLFNTIVTGDQVANGKPAPDLFLEAAKRLGVSPQNCLVFEDSEEGLLAAQRAGMSAKNVSGFNPFLPNKKPLSVC